jgi:hypothetical protein
MTSLLYSYSKETVGVMNSFIKRTPLPNLPEIVSDYPFPPSGRMKIQTVKESRSRSMTIIEDEKSRTYVIFNISRTNDMAKQFRVTGDLASNTSRILLVIGRQIIASSENIQLPIGESWFPIVAMPYQYFSVYCQLSDENGPKIGTIEFISCLLPDNERRKLGTTRLYPIGYDVVIQGGASLGDTMSEDKVVQFLRKKHPFIDKNSLRQLPLAGRIRLNQNRGVFDRMGHVFSDVHAKSNKSCEFILTANDLVIYRQPIEANTLTKIMPETYFVYAPYNEIGFEFRSDEEKSNDLSCYVERSESLLEHPVSNKIPYLIPELDLVMINGAYSLSQYYAEEVANATESAIPETPISEIIE